MVEMLDSWVAMICLMRVVPSCTALLDGVEELLLAFDCQGLSFEYHYSSR